MVMFMEGNQKVFLLLGQDKGRHDLRLPRKDDLGIPELYFFLKKNKRPGLIAKLESLPKTKSSHIISRKREIKDLLDAFQS